MAISNLVQRHNVPNKFLLITIHVAYILLNSHLLNEERVHGCLHEYISQVNKEYERTGYADGRFIGI